MTPEQALQNLAQAVAQISTNLNTHQVLQQSIQVLQAAIKPKLESIPANTAG